MYQKFDCGMAQPEIAISNPVTCELFLGIRMMYTQQNNHHISGSCASHHENDDETAQWNQFCGNKQHLDQIRYLRMLENIEIKTKP